MAMTIETISSLDDTIFENLYADSVDDIGAGSLTWATDMSDDDKKTFVKKGLNSNVKMLCKKDTTPIAYGSGYVIPEYSYYVDGDFTKEKIIHNNMFCFNFVIMANVDGNKNWVRTAEFFQAIKDYVVSQHSVNGIVIDTVKGKSVAVAFKQAQADGVCPGTYSVNGNGSTDSFIWIY